MSPALCKFVLGNFALYLLVFGFICSLVSLGRKLKPVRRVAYVETLFSFFLLFSIGVSSIYDFLGPVFFSQYASAFIGSAYIPYQREAGFAVLGLGIAGMISLRTGLGFRAATINISAFALWGSAGKHLYRTITADGYSLDSTGTAFWMHIFVPLIGFIFLYYQHRSASTWFK